ncbi:unnamed protein product [Ectocarpus fasciculatus]
MIWFPRSPNTTPCESRLLARTLHVPIVLLWRSVLRHRQRRRAPRVRRVHEQAQVASFKIYRWCSRQAGKWGVDTLVECLRYMTSPSLQHFDCVTYHGLFCLIASRSVSPLRSNGIRTQGGIRIWNGV